MHPRIAVARRIPTLDENHRGRGSPLDATANLNVVDRMARLVYRSSETGPGLNLSLEEENT
jgi:hypothetical protein